MTNEQLRLLMARVGLTMDEAVRGFDRFARLCREAAPRNAIPSVHVVKLGWPPRRPKTPLPIARLIRRRSGK